MLRHLHKSAGAVKTCSGMLAGNTSRNACLPRTEILASLTVLLFSTHLESARTFFATFLLQPDNLSKCTITIYLCILISVEAFLTETHVKAAANRRKQISFPLPRAFRSIPREIIILLLIISNKRISIPF